MKLLCIGDVALSDRPAEGRSWDVPSGVIPGPDERILFNFELPFGSQVNPTPRVRGPRLVADPTTISLIHQWSPGIAALATNHVLDAGVEGLVGTLKSLREEGFLTTGAGVTAEEISRPLIWETGEGKLGIINWVFSETHPDWERVPGPNCWPGLEKGCEAVRALKDQVDWVLVFPHWSDELFAYPTLDDREIARALLNAGADVIVGHHPHVVRGFEMVAGKPVFYSLGNFFFTDIHDLKKGTVSKPARRNREALAVSLDFRRGQKVIFETRSFWNGDGSTQPDRANRAVRRMTAVSKALSQVPLEEYAAWYLERRKFFNRFEYRIHFSLLKLGWKGIFRWAASRLLRYFKLFRVSDRIRQPKG